MCIASCISLFWNDDLERQRATPLSAEYPRWRAITGSSDYITICSNLVVVPRQAYARSYTHFGFETTSVSVPTGKLFVVLFSTAILNIRHKTVTNMIVLQSAVNEVTFEVMCNVLMASKTLSLGC